MTLHQELLNADIECDNYATDLLFQKTEKSIEILGKYPLLQKIAMSFKCDIDNVIWIEVPFNFEKGLVKNEL